MTATPLQVLSRPFAVEPITHVMLPDGIFDNAIYNLEITCHVTNTSSADLTDVEVYLEGVSDPGVAVVPHTHTLPRVPANATITVSWRANFENASYGLSLCAETVGGLLVAALAEPDLRVPDPVRHQCQGVDVHPRRGHPDHVEGQGHRPR